MRTKPVLPELHLKTVIMAEDLKIGTKVRHRLTGQEGTITKVLSDGLIAEVNTVAKSGYLAGINVHTLWAIVVMEIID